MAKHKVKISRKLIKEKYPTKQNVGEEVWQFAGRVFLVIGLFLVVAVSVDIYHFTH